jgi:hypothetical protein
MKHLYTLLFALSFFVPQSILAQCACSGGEKPDSIVYNYTLASTTSPIVHVSFPKFDPAIGTLTCLTYNDTINAISTTNVKNVDSSDQEYRFRLTVTNSLSAPGININDFVDKYYGPDSLRAAGSGVDSITYGPDTTFNNLVHQITKTSGLASYMGSGVVFFNYNINGGLISLSGGLNFSQMIRTTRWGKFKLTYYWCPNALLASPLKNFTVNHKDETVHLSWTSDNQSNTYEIEISTDGKNFTSVGQANEAATASGASAKYQYQYNLDQATAGTVYFRIKSTDETGKVTWSEVKRITVGNQEDIIQNIFPNPAVNSVQVKFGENIFGALDVSLVNSVGQTVFSKRYNMERSNQLNVTWPNKLTPGVYYLKARNVKTQSETISRLIVK